jgi:hypothetical protein
MCQLGVPLWYLVKSATSEMLAPTLRELILSKGNPLPDVTGLVSSGSHTGWI